MNGRGTLRRRVTLAGTAVVAILVLASDVFIYLSLRDQLYSNLEEVLDAREQLVVGLREELGPEEIYDHLDDVGVRAIVQTPDGPTYRSAGAPDLSTLPPGESDEPLATRTVPIEGGRVIVLASRGGIEQTLNRLLLFAGIGTIAVIGLGYLAFSRLAARMLRPLGDVAATARHISQGHRDQRLAPREDDIELREMVEAFNEMLDDLEAALSRSREAEASSRRFLADAAHQLRTPVAGIRATIGTLLRTPEGEEREWLLDNLAAEAARMSRLLSSLLRVARLDRAEEPDLLPTSLAELVTDLVEHQRVRAPSLRFDVTAPEHAVIRADRESLGEAIGNLLDNAARHAAGRVELEVAADDHALEVRVRDDGDGVEHDDRERIFDRFVSLDGGPGSGLGLPIARAVAETHGGSLHLEEPSTFVLSLPLPEGSLKVT